MPFTYKSFGERFWSKVIKELNVSVDKFYTPCWIWVGAINSAKYGNIKRDGKVMQAHVVSYNLLVGEVPNNKEIHHICERKNCVNPEHLKPVSDKGHGLEHQKEFCNKGHLLEGDNLYIETYGGRRCIQCRTEGRRLRDVAKELEKK
jgi:hypothetical protein